MFLPNNCRCEREFGPTIEMIAALRFVGRSRHALMTRCKSESKIFPLARITINFAKCVECSRKTFSIPVSSRNSRRAASSSDPLRRALPKTHPLLAYLCQLVLFRVFAVLMLLFGAACSRRASREQDAHRAGDLCALAGSGRVARASRRSKRSTKRPAALNGRRCPRLRPQAFGFPLTFPLAPAWRFFDEG